MAPEDFWAFSVKQVDTQYIQQVVKKSISNLPVGDILIQVQFSSLNYKDALSATGHYGVTKNYPHIPGIDAAGIVLEDTSGQFHPGDRVLVTGFDLGVNTWGGFAELIRVPAAWVLPLPAGLTPAESMILGTAGLTAALCVEALLQHAIQPASGAILVTGATGGVGSLAVALLAKLGFEVVAVTGKRDRHAYLTELGAARILSREQVNDTSDKPLLKGQWAGVVDTVGGNLLATAIRSTQYGGCVTACGLVGGVDLPLTVHPFILRGVRLIGIDSVNLPLAQRQQLWHRFATDWKLTNLEAIATTVTLTDLPVWIDRILKGQVVGRVLVHVAK
ncbi:MAG TPA: YhdH/YhfP family quinone oxidoreductase [Leptolyngbyaceae cyanobacterium M33_DOE_097]|uniref:Acryloyl-CoA reductase n=1 Tax=Oscillatoriales cyanobacterium SpSt-418 TaxID=2282169 RepID=A0A7C3KGW4_9CYAN|nr:YhdH/YhfP family quinone oxidoreductase [Leptolyngbyaceae cyanobacterium M33_DOE_097]